MDECGIERVPLRVGIIVHIGYAHLVKWVFDQLKTISCNETLFTLQYYISIVDTLLTSDEVSAILHRESEWLEGVGRGVGRGVEVNRVPNYGLDVAPFFQGLERWRMSPQGLPDIVIKLHTKRDDEIRTECWSKLLDVAAICLQYIRKPWVHLIVSSERLINFVDSYLN